MLVAIVGIDGNCEGFCLNIGFNVLCHPLVIVHPELIRGTFWNFRVCMLVTPALCIGRQSVLGTAGDTWSVSMPGGACWWFVLCAWRICLDFCRVAWFIWTWFFITVAGPWRRDGKESEGPNLGSPIEACEGCLIIGYGYTGSQWVWCSGCLAVQRARDAVRLCGRVTLQARGLSFQLLWCVRWGQCQLRCWGCTEFLRCGTSTGEEAQGRQVS